MTKTRGMLLMGAAVASMVMSGTALAVSLTHAGPRGPQGVQGTRGPVGPRGPAGSQGDAGKAAETAHLGVCVSYFTDTTGTGNFTWAQNVTAPVVTNGVDTCPTGSFVSITPQGN